MSESRRKLRPLRALASSAAVLLCAPAFAAAAPDPLPYGANDAGGFRNILPPGQGQSVNAAEIALFFGAGTRPAHDSDQLRMYSDLVYATPGLKQAELDDYYKDATFGALAGDVERTYSPRSDVTIVHDEFGVPRIYGEGRAGAMFGAGYIAAEDRMFFIDALRHSGRAQLASFAGGSIGNRRMDRSVYADTPYRNDAEFQVQYDLADEAYGAAGVQVQKDVTNYVAGINHRISEIRANPLIMPGEYPLLGHPAGPEDWSATDVIATASLVAGIFGKGGGGEVGSALVLEAARKRFGKRKGTEVWKDFRRANDPEAPTTVRGKRFPYMNVPRGARAALPDPGTTRTVDVVASTTASREQARAGAEANAASRLPDVGDLLGSLRDLDGNSSNALLVSRRESEGGRPVAVMGPQVSYYTPQILIEFEIHAPAGPEGPPLDARGTAFPGTNLYVQLGHGRNYAFSATSAGQDIIDTFAARLCEPGGGKPTMQSMGYVFRGRCTPIDVLERTNSWTQSVGDMTPSGSEIYRAERTALGIVTHRARIDGRPVAFTRNRATYYHEVDSALGFADYNNPQKMESPAEFMKAACKIDYTFNWFFVNRKHTAYFNTGINPVRAAKAHPDLPTPGKRRFEWQGWTPPSKALLSGGPINQQNVDPRTNISEQEPCSAHPQAVDQRYLTSWNNKQAPGFRAADGRYGYGPLYRSLRLDRRIESRIRGSKKMALHELVDAMEDAGTVDLRGSEVLPLALEVIERANVRTSGKVRGALATLRRWMRDGAHRRDKNRDGTYDDAEAVRIMDAWWPRWLAAEFKPKLGGNLFEEIQRVLGFHNAPGPTGSAFASGWYGYAHKDLRMVLGERVRGAFAREYCGGGRLRGCGKALVRSLSTALGHTSDAELYAERPCDQGDAQWCNDAVRHTATGAISQPPIHWIDRPTFQQAVQVGKP
jgi:acyl-homoserine lactone acylase PvdQ